MDPGPTISCPYSRHKWVDRIICSRALESAPAQDSQRLPESMQLWPSVKGVDQLLGFTGIDYCGVLLLLYEIDDTTRFSNPTKLVSWIGLAPSLYQSANTRRTEGITIQGTKRIRWFLTEAAQMAARPEPRMIPFYERISRKKVHEKALIAVARKMLVSIYYVLTRNQKD